MEKNSILAALFFILSFNGAHHGRRNAEESMRILTLLLAVGLAVPLMLLLLMDAVVQPTPPPQPISNMAYNLRQRVINIIILKVWQIVNM